MSYLLVILGVVVLLLILQDTFQTIIVPRTAVVRYRLTRLFYAVLNFLWTNMTRHIKARSIRVSLMAGFAPFSLLLLFVVWAIGLIFGFALIHTGLHTPFNNMRGQAGFSTDLYFSGVTFLTLGFGDVAPTGALGRFLAVCEAGVGFGFLAVVISYLPVMYQAFSKRETLITLMDARAGSPPSAGVLLRRYAEADNMEELIELLAQMERWAAELLEGYLSYPILAWYRSQHDDESWLTTLTTIMDACALISLEFKNRASWEKKLRWQAYLTFAMARHAIVDLSQVIFVPPQDPPEERLTPKEWEKICQILDEADTPICDHDTAWKELLELRRQYEPYVYALSQRLFLNLPPWIPDQESPDNWQTSAWDNRKHL